MIKHILFHIRITLYYYVLLCINVCPVMLLHINISPSEYSYAVDLICISDCLYVKMFLGNPGQFATIHVNTARDISWTTTFYFNNHHSSTLSPPKTETIYFDDYKINVGKYNDEAVFVNKNTVPYNTTFNPLVVSNWFFYYLDEGLINEFETIGMSFKYRNNEFNMIERLYRDNKIKHKEFTLINNYYYTTDFKSGVMIIGKGSKIEYTSDSVSKGVCNVFTNSNYTLHWGCKLNYVELTLPNYNNNNNGVYRLTNTKDTSYSFFQTNQKPIYAPLPQFNHLINAITSSIGDTINNKCKVNEKLLYYTFQCECDYIKTKNISITFNIDNYIYTLSDIFYSELNDYCTFIIHSRKSTEQVWILGMDFIKNYDITFDYSNSLITLYGVNISLLSNNQQYKYILVNIEIIILLLSISVLVAIKYYYSK